MEPVNDYRCEIIEPSSLEETKNIWLSVEKNSSGTIFLSWLWIGTWLKTHVESYKLILAFYGDKVVGCSILIQTRSNLIGKIYLNQTGNGELDQVWIEYNDFLIAKGHVDKVKPIMASTLYSNIRWLDRVTIGISTQEQLSIFNSFIAYKNINWLDNSYKLDFTKLRNEQLSIDEYLSSNLKKQIRRSINKYKSLGDLELKKSNNKIITKSWFSEIAKYHKDRWGRDSGFNNGFFVKFHRAMFESDTACSMVRLYKLDAGEHNIGYAYIYIYKNEAYFYLSGINYNLPHKHCKPGMVLHYLITKELWEEGIDGYDFLGGEAEYKKRFSNEVTQLMRVEYTKKNILTRTENMLRLIKQKVFT